MNIGTFWNRENVSPTPFKEGGGSFHELSQQESQSDRAVHDQIWNGK